MVVVAGTVDVVVGSVVGSVIVVGGTVSGTDGAVAGVPFAVVQAATSTADPSVRAAIR